MNKYIAYCRLAVLQFLLISAVNGQESDTGVLLSRAAQYHLGDKDQILMNVNVWGYVSQPGQYVVPRHTDLITLISFAGGPVAGADLEHVNIIRGGDLVKGVGGENGHNSNNGHNGKNGKNSLHKNKVPILTVNVRSHMKTGEIGKIPILYAGDTVIIPESSGSKFSRFMGLNSIVSIITAMASLTIIIERI